uniref:Ubiquitin-like protease family profile domain-containing protein n=1 Tax=Trichogramma kaykai TaxID=54128 RepID=A0ABD2VUF9_9HYME
MNTREIERALSGIDCNSVGVYAADRVPRNVSLPACLIINCDTSDQPGSHWIALYIDKYASGIYFDSFGLPPTNTHHKERIHRICKKIIYNYKCLQSLDSAVCGEYCIFFLYHISKNNDLNAFLNYFNSDTRRNDNIVRSFYKKLITKKQKKQNVKIFLNENNIGYGVQNCRPKM